jgi:tetratricopeptide (TPR) repeat protein
LTLNDDDHLPPPAKKMTGTDGSVEAGAVAPRSSSLGDRILFTCAGLLFGFAAAFVYLEKNPNPVPAAVESDPHAGLSGVGPGATRDLPGAGGGAPQMATDPALRQKLIDLEAAAAQTPDNYDVVVQLGNAAYDAEQWPKAVAAYERALKIKDGDVNVLTDLGVSYRSTGDTNKALECFTRALSADPKHWPALFNQAIVYGIDRGDVAHGRELLARLKKEHPEIPSLDKLDAEFERRLKESKPTARS